MHQTESSCDRSETAIEESLVNRVLADPSRFGAWLAAIVRNNALDHLRRRLRRNEIAVDPLKIAENPADLDPSNAGFTRLESKSGEII